MPSTKKPKRTAAAKDAAKTGVNIVIHCYCNKGDEVERRLFAVALWGQKRVGMAVSTTLKRALVEWLDAVSDPRKVPLSALEIVDLAPALKLAKVVVDDGPTAKYPLLNVHAGSNEEAALLARLDPISKYGPTKSHVIKAALSQFYDRFIRERAGEATAEK
jgi:hypothetical protein